MSHEQERVDYRTDILIGKTVDEAEKFIELNNVFYPQYFGILNYKITEIRVVKIDGENQSRIKDIRDSEEKMRLNVYIRNGIITHIEDVE